MLTQDEIIAGNKLIINSPFVKKNAKVYYLTKKRMHVEDLRYHRSWDWLIPVLNSAIRVAMELNVDFLGKAWASPVAEGAWRLAQWNLMHALDRSDVNGQWNIESSWRKLTDFIKWYNSRHYTALEQKDHREIWYRAEGAGKFGPKRRQSYSRANQID